MGYWVVSLGLSAFGLITGFSIGRPFLLVGLAMLILGPLRSRPVLYWPPLVAVIAYNVGYWAVAPLVCTTTGVVGEAAATTCTNLIGIDYSGTGTYNPPLEPANQAGLLLGALSFVIVLAAMLWQGQRAKTRI